jgi:predicted GIY-YIG superfamily endonuclease
MKPFFVYILKCSDASYYVGHTDGIEKRMAEHNLGECHSYVATRLPVNIVYVEEFATRDEAIIAECAIKGWTRRKKEALINGDFQKLSQLSKKKFN